MGNDRNDRHPRRQENHDPDLVSAVNTPYLTKWTDANKLSKNEHLKASNGATVTVVGGTVPKQHDGWMWDLTVPGNNDHDFYVVVTTATAVLVHNCNEGEVSDPEPQYKPSGGRNPGQCRLHQRHG